MMVNMLKKLALSDILIVLVMGFLLYYGASWQIFAWYTDVGKYECYSMAFWHGVSALKTLPIPEMQCHFITHPRPETIFITTDTLIQIMNAHNLPHWLISFVSAQSPTQPFHALPHEYPLLTILPFSFGLVTAAHWYQVAFAVSMALLAGAMYFVLKTWQSKRAAVAFAIYVVVGCWATAGTRYDIIPAALSLGALLLAEHGRWRWAYAVLAVATMFKFYPIFLVPAFFIAQCKSCNMFWHKWWKGLDTFVLVCAVITTFSLLLSVEGTLGPFGYFGNRPIQAESTAASILWIASFFGFPLHYTGTYGSLNMLSSLSSIVSPMMTLFLVAGLTYVGWLQWRGRISLAVSILLTLLIVICTGKVFSPQYLLWVIPFVAYIGECNWRWLLSWTGISLLTTLIYPYIYTATTVFVNVPTLPTFNPVVFARNVSLVVFLVVLLYRNSVQRKSIVISIEDIPRYEEREAIASMAQAD